MHHQQILEAGVRVFAISVDPPGRNAAMVQKLSLPFPYLSDPDRSRAIIPYGVADEKDERRIARPAIVVLTPEHEVGFRFVSRDFADRLPEDQVIGALQQFGLPAITQDRPENGTPDPVARSLSPSQLKVYFRGARYAALTMGLRHARHAEEIKVDSKAYVAEMDRFTAAIDWLRNRSGS